MMSLRHASCRSSSVATTAATRVFAARTLSTQTSDPNKTVVVVDGIRLPFAMSSTIYSDQLGVDLQRLAFKGLMDKTAVNKEDIDYVIAGTVIQEVRTSNIAREAAINAGLPNRIGAHTVSMVSHGLLVQSSERMSFHSPAKNVFAKARRVDSTSYVSIFVCTLLSTLIHN